MPTLIRTLCPILLALPLMLLWVANPCYAGDGKEALRAELNEAYQNILKHPGDRVLSLQYGAIAMKLEDYETAIPPLERILMNEPDNAKIKVQVGVLYQALGSKLMAKQYFLDATHTEGASPEVIKQAEGYLRAL